MHLEQILRNLENDFGTLSQKTGLKDLKGMKGYQITFQPLKNAPGG